MQAQAGAWQRTQLPLETGDTEAEWIWFCRTAETGLREATALHSTLRDPPFRRAKGTLHRAFPIQGKVACQARHGSYAMRKLLNLQGRVREMCRQSERGVDPALSVQVERTWRASLGEWPSSAEPECLLSLVDEAVAHLQRDQTRSDVHKWQQGIAKCGRKATAWLRGKQRAVTCVLPHDAEANPNEAVSVRGSLHNIRRYWRTIWRRPSINRAQAVQHWRDHGRRCSFRGRLAGIFTARNLAVQARRKAGSAPSVDGWSGDEVAALPDEAWHSFAVLVLRWFRRGVFPRVWHQARQIHLPKDEPTIAAGSMRADQLRPITIMSVWWRIVGSTFATHESVQQWLNQIVDESQVGGLKGRQLHMGLACVCESFEEGSAVASLDYQKCFDSVSPDLACDVLAEAGLSSPVVRALRSLWQQTRFLELGGVVLDEGEFIGASLPQGDPISPLAPQCPTGCPVQGCPSQVRRRLSSECLLRRPCPGHRCEVYAHGTADVGCVEQDPRPAGESQETSADLQE